MALIATLGRLELTLLVNMPLDSLRLPPLVFGLER